MSVHLTTTTTLCLSYGATACLWMCMFRHIGYSCLSFGVPSTRLPRSGTLKTPTSG